VAHACNPSSAGNQEDGGVRKAQAKMFMRPHLNRKKKKSNKLGAVVHACTSAMMKSI
jgi:hypothetical protein